MDVEYSEWDSLEKMFEEKMLDRVKQLVIEVHTKEEKKKKSTVDDLLRYSNILTQLELIGFRMWRWHFNKSGSFRGHNYPSKNVSCCYELSYVNSKYLTSVSV